MSSMFCQELLISADLAQNRYWWIVSYTPVIHSSMGSDGSDHGAVDHPEYVYDR